MKKYIRILVFSLMAVGACGGFPSLAQAQLTGPSIVQPNEQVLENKLNRLVHWVFKISLVGILVAGALAGAMYVMDVKNDMIVKVIWAAIWTLGFMSLVSGLAAILM